MKKILSILFVILVFLSPITEAQESSGWFSWPEGLGFSNHLEYSYNTDTDREILENWLNLALSCAVTPVLSTVIGGSLCFRGLRAFGLVETLVRTDAGWKFISLTIRILQLAEAKIDLLKLTLFISKQI